MSIRYTYIGILILEYSLKGDLFSGSPFRGRRDLDNMGPASWDFELMPIITISYHYHYSYHY